MYNIFFFKQKTAYEMRISDWSSDVCSSDLEVRDVDRRPESEADSLRENNPMEQKPIVKADDHKACPNYITLHIPSGAENQALPNSWSKNGRASCRERVCQYV